MQLRQSTKGLKSPIHFYSDCHAKQISDHIMFPVEHFITLKEVIFSDWHHLYVKCATQAIHNGLKWPIHLQCVIRPKQRSELLVANAKTFITCLSFFNSSLIFILCPTIGTSSLSSASSSRRFRKCLQISRSERTCRTQHQGFLSPLNTYGAHPHSASILFPSLPSVPLHYFFHLFPSVLRLSRPLTLDTLLVYIVCLNERLAGMALLHC